MAVKRGQECWCCRRKEEEPFGANHATRTVPVRDRQEPRREGTRGLHVT